jgi:flavin reductase (DIM6/NTAB) family NADH-FMN oxidoreductase RutF
VARQLEPVVPSALAALLRRDPAETVGFTVLVITTDPAGWPALAMVSAGELAVVTPDRLALVLWPRSGAAANVTRSGRATLSFVTGGASYVLRAQARRLDDLPLSPDAQLACFVLTVAEATEDRAPYATLTSGVRFELSDPEATVARWRRTRALLDSLG